MTTPRVRSHEVLRWVGTFCAALFGGGILGVLPVLPLGLSLDERVLFPLALMIGALLAGICASMVNTSDTLKVVGISTAAAALLVALPPIMNPWQNSYQWYAAPWLVKNWFIVALVATVAALRVSSKHTLRRNMITATILIGIGILAIEGTIYVASFFGLTGA